jgi:Zn-dependent hydrolases, including glyoxylases
MAISITAPARRRCHALRRADRRSASRRAFWLDKLPDQSTRFGFPAPRRSNRIVGLQDGETVQFGDETLEVYHCPGHTPGHVVFFSRAHRLALVGDVLFAGSIGRTDFPRGNHADLVRSIREKLWPLGDDIHLRSGPRSHLDVRRRAPHQSVRRRRSRA